MLDDPFLQKENKIPASKLKDAFLKSGLNLSALGKGPSPSPKKGGFRRKSDRFESRLEETLQPTLSAKELIENIVRTALEVEFGHSFTISPGFAKMVSTIADAIVTNPELRRQALAIASIYIGRKLGPKDRIKQ
jgi:hypothetical protein